MNEFISKRNETVAKNMIPFLEKRGFEGYFAKDKEEAKKIALDLIKEGSSVTWGGTVSAEEIGLKSALKEGNYVVYDRAEAKNEDEVQEIYRKAYFCDYFLASANAITEKGEIVNIDGNANRVSAIAFGPKNVLFIVGVNKIVKDVEDGLTRARNYSAPINGMRLGLSTPCAKTGVCMDCMAPDCMCCQFMITRKSKVPGRIKIILVNENLGF